MKRLLLVGLTIVSLVASNVYAAENTPARPPANVVVENSSEGMLSPSSPFVGTVRFSDVSSVAAESAGKIKSVRFDDGDYVSAGDVLAVIDGELLEKTLAEAEAGLERIEANLQLAQNDYERTEKLFSENATSQQDYDSKKYNAIALDKQKAAQSAAIDNLKAQLKKKTVYAPYDGIVVSRNISLGEWANTGSIVAEIAKTGDIDLLVNVPETLLKYLRKGLQVHAEASGRNVEASFHTVVPSGDTGNRTFPVKFRTTDTAGLLEGMEAKVNLPSSVPEKVIFVNRDAIVNSRQGTIVYTVADNAASPLPVSLVGYEGRKAGVHSEVLKAGMPVIVKGNERLQPGQPVSIIGK